MPALEFRKVVSTGVTAATLERSTCQIRRQGQGQSLGQQNYGQRKRGACKGDIKTSRPPPKKKNQQGVAPQILKEGHFQELFCSRLVLREEIWKVLLGFGQES